MSHENRVYIGIVGIAGAGGCPNLAAWMRGLVVRTRSYQRDVVIQSLAHHGFNFATPAIFVDD